MVETVNGSVGASDPTRRQGLTHAEVVQRVASGLVNRVSQRRGLEYGRIVARNLFTLFNLLVFSATIALFLLEEYRGAIAVSGLAILNSTIGLAQELRAKRHLDRLAILAEPRARVIRDGQVQRIPAGEVVRDDHLLLSAGEAVHADGVVLTARYLEIDEALLTGESDPVPAEPGRRLLSGTFCVAGEGVYRAEQVGNEACAHRTGLEARRYHFRASPLQHTINRLLEILTVVAIGLCLLYVVLYFVRGFSTTDLVQMAAATITSMIPQGLVLMTTLAFILGAVRMSKRGAIVQNLNAVESMAAVNVLCLDKTGTLTTNNLCLDQVRVLDPEMSEEGARRLLRLFAGTSLDENSKTIQALRVGLGEDRTLEVGEVLDRLPFKSQNRYSAVRLGRVGDRESAGSVLVLGGCEALQPFLPPDLGAYWAALLRDMQPSGLRVLMFARAIVPPGQAVRAFQGRLADLALSPVALIGLSDELRPDAAAVLAALASQGIRYKIISGDHADTVQAVVRKLGLPLGQEDVVTGDELTAAPNRDELVKARTLFARVAPRQKVQIVETLQAQGNQVAMIGDGINDILAIKRANLGIAMGDGASATRTVAGLVLENNRFDLLPATLAEGRNILRNLRRVGKIFLLKNVYTLFLIVATLGVFQLEFPYLPQQVTLLNKLTITLPMLVITLSRTSAATTGHAGFLRHIGRFALSTGTILGLTGLAVLLLSTRGFGDPVRTARTMLLSTLILLALGNLHRVLTGEGERLTRSDYHFLWWVPAAILLYGGAMYWPAAADFFQLAPLPLSRWGIVVGLACPALLICLALDARRSEGSSPSA